MEINAENLHFKDLNDKIRNGGEDLRITNCYGQRFMAASSKGQNITIDGTPGNALGCYLDGSTITVRGNAQDAVGDTMNDGKIIIYGSAGDALGYAMRGGSMFVRGDSGYRTGIHMKEYKEKRPVIIIGGKTGSFLGEYMAGGLLVVLGIDYDRVPVGNFTGTGMHGGKIFIRTEHDLVGLPAQVLCDVASDQEKAEIAAPVREFCEYFGHDAQEILAGRFCVLTPNAKNPYKQLYTAN